MNDTARSISFQISPMCGRELVSCIHFSKYPFDSQMYSFKNILNRKLLHKWFLLTCWNGKYSAFILLTTRFSVLKNFLKNLVVMYFLSRHSIPWLNTYYLCVFVSFLPLYMHIDMHRSLSEPRRTHYRHWSWSYAWLWTIMCVLIISVLVLCESKMCS